MRSLLRNIVGRAPFLPRLGHFLLRRALPVFMFHRVLPDQAACYDPEMNTPPEGMDQFLAGVKESFEVLPLEACLRVKLSRDKVRKPVCAITFDDGWQDNFEFAYPLLKKHGVPATIFLASGFIGTRRRFWQERLWLVLSSFDSRTDRESLAAKLGRSVPWCPPLTASDLRFSRLKPLLMWQNSCDAEHFVAQLEDLHPGKNLETDRAFLNWQEIREMHANGVSFGSHTVNHVLLTCAAPATAQLEIDCSRRQLQDQLDAEIACFSYPWGSTFGYLRNQVASAGYRFACVTETTYQRAPEDPFLISRIPVSGPLLSGRKDLFDRRESNVSLGVSALRARKITPLPLRTDERIRIAFVIDSIDGWDAGGTETQVRHLLAALDRDHFLPKLFFLAGSAGLSDDHLPCPVFVAKRPSRFRGLSMVASLAEALREFRPHVVQTFFRDGTLFGTCAAKLARVPVIVQSVRNLGYWMNRADRAMQPFLRSMSSTLQCNSRAIYDSLDQWHVRKSLPACILPNFIDLERFSPVHESERGALRKQLQIPEKGPVVVNVSNLTSVKDHSTLIRAVQAVRTTLPDSYFLLVGDGPLRTELSQQIQRSGLEASVKLLGPQLDVRAWLAVADLGVLTSRSEGSSNSVLEYMAMGLPSVLSAIPANRELVDGVFYEVGNPDDLADKIISLWNSPVQREQLSSQYRALAMQYGGTVFRERAQAFYVRLIAGGTTSQV